MAKRNCAYSEMESLDNGWRDISKGLFFFFPRPGLEVVGATCVSQNFPSVLAGTRSALFARKRSRLLIARRFRVVRNSWLIKLVYLTGEVIAILQFHLPVWVFPEAIIKLINLNLYLSSYFSSSVSLFRISSSHFPNPSTHFLPVSFLSH